LWGALPLGISFALLFFGPTLDGVWKILYALGTFLLFCTFYTVVNVPYGALTAAMSMDSEVRGRITGYRMAFALLGTLLVAGLTRPIVDRFPSMDAGFRFTAIVFGAAALIFTWITFFFTREQYVPEKKGKFSFSDELRCLTGNRPFLILTLATLLQYIALGVIASMVNYYFKYLLSMESFIPIAFLSMFSAAIAVMPLWVFLSGRIGKRSVFISGMALLALALFLLRFIVNTGTGPIIALLILAGIGLSTIYLSPWSMIPDTVEYSEWKTGLRREGTLYGVFYFAQKLAVALAGFICGTGLSLSGYTPNAIQTPGANRGIEMLMTTVPVVIIVLGIVVIRFYEIDDNLHKKIRKELLEREGTRKE